MSLLPRTLNGETDARESFGRQFTIILNDDTALRGQLIDYGQSDDLSAFVFEVSVPQAMRDHGGYVHVLMEADVYWHDDETEGVLQLAQFRDGGDPSKNRSFRIHEMGVRRIIDGWFYA